MPWRYIQTSGSGRLRPTRRILSLELFTCSFSSRDWRDGCTLRNMLKRLTPLEDTDLIDVFERQLEKGVHVDGPVYGSLFDEDSRQAVLGGLITAEEHVSIREL